MQLAQFSQWDTHIILEGYSLKGLDEPCVRLSQHLQGLVKVLSELTQRRADN
ncbi:hypothetical protein DPMN_149370 [Dreissena polymorpha]|uniref:Uncharacterized protein n=1 Tax=Dreissena polymorpha TaxID=45954 RepID=A0A9D4FDM9_DREPO|nr:hypothetical protein DPMN_149370 [Dreissena polymorpha]